MSNAQHDVVVFGNPSPLVARITGGPFAAAFRRWGAVAGGGSTASTASTLASAVSSASGVSA